MVRLDRLLAQRRGEGTRRHLFRPRSIEPLLGPARWARAQVQSLWYRHRVARLDLSARVLGVGRVVRALPAFQGVFELDLRSHVTKNLLLDNFEGSLLPLFQAALPQDDETGDVIDIGANMGLYSVLAARLLCGRNRVLAVEPAPSVLALLQENLRRNGVPEVEVFAGALSDHPGQATLHVQPGNEEYASLGGQDHPHAPSGGKATVTVATETLDALCAHLSLRPSFLKIDTEGAEGLVLAGAHAVLHEHRPVILSELDDRLLRGLGTGAREVLARLSGHGYHCFDAYSGEGISEKNVSAPFIGEIVALPEADT